MTEISVRTEQDSLSSNPDFFVTSINLANHSVKKTKLSYCRYRWQKFKSMQTVKIVLALVALDIHVTVMQPVFNYKHFPLQCKLFVIKKTVNIELGAINKYFHHWVFCWFFFYYEVTNLRFSLQNIRIQSQFTRAQVKAFRRVLHVFI